MTKHRAGYHNVTIQLTEAAWGALCTEATARDVSATMVLNEVLHRHYKIPLNRIPPPRRTGRRPKPADDGSVPAG